MIHYAIKQKKFDQHSKKRTRIGIVRFEMLFWRCCCRHLFSCWV